jgi:uncharacterized membrane protein
MHIVFVLIGAAVGAWIGGATDEILGMLAGAVVASLLFRLSAAQATIERLSRRLDNLEQRQLSAIPQQPSPAKMAPATSSFESEPPVSTVVAAAETPPREAPKTIVHPRVPETPAQPGPLAHAIEVAKRWLTTGNVPVKVGVIVSFFGVAFLLKFAVENSDIEIPISVRYLAIAAFAAVLLLLGWRMRSTQRVYALSLQGGGIGVSFLTVFAAFQLHELMPPTIAFAILVLITLGAGALAVFQESRALAILGTTGGFLAPLLVSTGSGDHVALFSYYLILNAAVLGVAWYRPWRELNLIGFFFTFGVGTLWGIEYYVPELFASTEPFLIAHFLFYTAIAVLFAFRQRPTLRGFVDGTLVFGTPTIAFALQTQLLPNSEYGLAISAALVAAFYAALAMWLRRTQARNFDLLAMSFVALAVGFATIAIPLAMDDRWTAIAWALEGAALVWIGVRQSGTLARVSGAVLIVASGAVFIDYGWVYDTGYAVMNGNYLGGTLISLTSFYAAWMLRSDSNGADWQRVVNIGLLVWALLWWFGIGSLELMDHAQSKNLLHFQFLFCGGSFAAMAWVALRLRWSSLRFTTFLFLVLLTVALVAYLVAYEHMFRGLGSLAWIVAFATHLWILYAARASASKLVPIWHGWGAVFIVVFAGLEARWQVDRQVVNDVWWLSAGLFPLAAGAAVILYLRDKVRWPIKANFDAYFTASMLLISAYSLLLLTVCIDDPGSPSPLPYLPILNPYDILSILGLAVGAYAFHVAAVSSQWPDNRFGDAPLWLWGGVAFVLATLAVVRGVHHLVDVPWQQRAIMDSAVAQTSLTIFWAALGVAGMLLGTRRSSRSIYILGGALMLIVILKLGVIDFQNNETIFGIASFLGVGLMLLAVGYYSPIPPKHVPERDNSVAS